MRVNTFSQVACLLGTSLLGDDARFNGISIDTRTILPGDLFIAIKGPHHDGHAFLQLALDHGAVGAIVSRDVGKLPMSYVQVEDTRIALGQLAGAVRQQVSMPLIAVTGSNGKTTVKEIIASIFRQSHKVLATQGNRNNDIGMPLTLLELRSDYDVAVIEMGTNHRGEIDYLSRIACPTVAVITNAAPAHLEGFGSVRDVASEKADIFNALAADGCAVINADDDYYGYWRQRARDYRQLSFGLNNPADVTADYRFEGDRTRMSLRYHDQVVDTHIKLLGEHNVRNALAAATVAFASGVPANDIAEGLANVEPVKGRLNVHQLSNNITVIDDSYNANPDSMEAAILVLAAHLGETVLVFGDMGELGVQSRKLHARVGKVAKSNGIDRLLAYGPMTVDAVDAFGPGGHNFDDIQSLIKALEALKQPEMAVLVKGSRSMKMERVVNALMLSSASAIGNPQ